MTFLLWALAAVLLLAFMNAVAFWFGLDVAGLSGALEHEGAHVDGSEDAHGASTGSAGAAGPHKSAAAPHTSAGTLKTNAGTPHASAAAPHPSAGERTP